MEKITIVIEKSKDFYDAFSENCDGIYAAGESIEAVKKDVEHAISILKKYPANQQPAPLRGEYEIEWKFDVQSFLEYYKDYLSLAGLEKITGINQKQLSNYLNEHVENDLAPALLDKAVSIVQSAVSIPESFIVNEEDGKQLNVESIDLDEK